MDGTSVILDNVVLSGFHTADWFPNLEFWTPDYTLVVSERVWEDEFLGERDVSSPSWLNIESIDRKIEPERPGELSDYDWRCIILAEDNSGILVTRDKKTKETAEGRGIRTMWDARFLIDTFEQCGISVARYRENIDNYLADGYFPSRVEQAIKDAEKIE